jgi:hypothetical protein
MSMAVEDDALTLHEASQVQVDVEMLESGGMFISTRLTKAVSPPRTNLLEQLAVPIMSLALGGGVYVLLPKCKILAQLLMFFGAQTFMNLYMKAILSNAVISEELQMRGFQAPLALTALQQLVGFFLLALAILVSQLTPWAYKPRVVISRDEVLAIMSLAVCFTLNIALNNFSLSLLDMSVNVMIRSTSPLTSLILQLCFRRWFNHEDIDARPVKVGLMLLGVIFAVLVVISKYAHKKPLGSNDNISDTLGLALCICSLVFSSMELIIVVILGKGFRLNSIDSLLYMAIPVVVMLLLPCYLIKHPVAYPGHGAATDFSVLAEVAHLSPGTVMLVMLSGLWALIYNLLLYNIVSGLSPYFASFAANFNKVAAIGLSLLLGLESLPAGHWGCLMCVGVVGNIACFTAYSVWPKQPHEENRERISKGAAKLASA